MDILYLLIPLSAVLVILILGLFGWALGRGQFEDVEREGERILDDERVIVEPSQESRKGAPEQSFVPDREESDPSQGFRKFQKSHESEKSEKSDKS